MIDGMHCCTACLLDADAEEVSLHSLELNRALNPLNIKATLSIATAWLEG